MSVPFYIAGIVAVISTFMVITRKNAVHALLYLIVSLLAISLIFYFLGAPFVAALEMIIYAGAIMVLFVFVIMMLNLGPRSIEQERQWLGAKVWAGPALLAAILGVELFCILVPLGRPPLSSGTVTPKQVGIALLGPYVVGAELASMLLLAGIMGAYHLGKRLTKKEQGEKDAAS